jgi:transketolase
MELLDPRTKMAADIAGCRGGFGLCLGALIEEFQADELSLLKVITPDTSTSGGLARLIAAYPEAFINVGISEQASVLIAGGLALTHRPIVATFAPFVLFRPYEQIRLVSSYMQLPVTYVGYAGGFDLGYLGFTHCAVEDIGAAINLGLVVYVPSCAEDVFWSIQDAWRSDRSSYIRLGSNPKIPKWLSESPIIGSGYRKYQFNSEGESSKVVLSYGSLMPAAKSAAFDVGVDCLAVIKIDEDSLHAVIAAVSGYSDVFVVEDHIQTSGLASLLRSRGLTARSIGKLFDLSVCGDFVSMTEALELDAASISATIKRDD